MVMWNKVDKKIAIVELEDKHVNILRRAIEDNYGYYDWNDKYDLGEIIVELIEQVGEIVWG